MTRAKSVTVSLDEILTLVLECSNEECRTKVTLESNARRKAPNKCPGCEAEWWKETTAPNTDSAGNVLRNFQIAILKLLEFQEKKARAHPRDEYYYLGCNVALEIK